MKSARWSTNQPAPEIGLLTALPKEYTAVKALLLEFRDVSLVDGGAARHYLLGKVPASNVGQHTVVLTLLSDMGNNSAAVGATLLLQHFPTVLSIIMVGIAGGVPNPQKASEHVRLGDVVVSDRNGVLQYDFDKETLTEVIHRHPPRPPSAALLDGVRYLQATELEGKRPWEHYIDIAGHQLGIVRPSDSTDVLACSADAARAIAHPDDPQRRPGYPRVFFGSIASANKLLKNPSKRDALRDRFGVKAVEMEGSGIADASWIDGVGYLVIRGVCDYCDANKGDEWQAYAAIAAAAFTRALLESMPSASIAGRTSGADRHSIAPEWWQRLATTAATLYPRGPEESQVWVRAGGDLGALDLHQTGRASWFAAVNRLKLGGGGRDITVQALLQAMQEDYADNDDLQALACALAL